MPLRWHILTGEYPPASGGVGDYTAQLASALTSAGDRVTVWTPGSTLADRFGPKSRAVLAEALRSDPGIVLLQYVPNALGARGMNLRFCFWLRDRARDGADVRVMFHEPYFYFALAKPWRNVLAIVQRVMARVLLDAAHKVYVSTETWRRYLTPPAATSFEVLPIPSTIPNWPLLASRPMVEGYLRAISPDHEPIVGHFGTYGDHVEGELLRVLPSIAQRCPTARFAFIGKGSTEFLSRFRDRYPAIAKRSWASGRLDVADLENALGACNVLAQPYPDGITTRRTSAMAGLQSAVAMVTTSGDLTEAIWAQSEAVRLVPQGDASAFAEAVAALLENTVGALKLGQRGAQTYHRHFSLERTLAVLRAQSATAP